MATRAGRVDPGLVLWLLEHAGSTPTRGRRRARARVRPARPGRHRRHARGARGGRGDADARLGARRLRPPAARRRSRRWRRRSAGSTCSCSPAGSASTRPRCGRGRRRARLPRRRDRRRGQRARRGRRRHRGAGRARAHARRPRARGPRDRPARCAALAPAVASTVGSRRVPASSRRQPVGAAGRVRRPCRVVPPGPLRGRTPASRASASSWSRWSGWAIAMSARADGADAAALRIDRQRAARAAGARRGRRRCARARSAARGPAPKGSATARWRSTRSVLASSSSISWAVDPRWRWRAISASRPAMPPPAMTILGMAPRLGAGRTARHP